MAYRKGRRYRGRRRLRQTATAVIPRSFNPYAGTMDVARPRRSGKTSAAKNYKPRTYSKRSIGTQTATSTGDYNQMTKVNIRGGYKPRVTLMRLAKEVRNRSEPVVFRFQGLKSFDDNGYYFANCGLNAGSTATDMPCYIADLTGIQNVGSNGTLVAAQPLRRASWNITTSNITWAASSGIISDGSTTSANLQIEKRPWNSTLSYPHEKSRLLWTDVKLNLWGTQTKPTEWTVQLVKFNDENLDPWNTPTNQVEHTTFWQSQLKHYVYNPIATTSGPMLRRGMKVLKTYTRIIQPTANYENDPDPHVITLKMFNKWYRDLSYKNGGKILDGDPANTILAPDYVSATASDQCKEYTDTRHKIFLLLRAKVFNRQDSPTINNITSPSFDIVIRTCHETQ